MRLLDSEAIRAIEAPGFPTVLLLIVAAVVTAYRGRAGAISRAAIRAGRRNAGGEFCELVLRHHEGAIEAIRATGGGDYLRTERTGGWRVNEARIPRMLYSMDDGSIAMVTVRLRWLPLQLPFHARVRAGALSGDGHDGRLRAGGAAALTAHRGRAASCHRWFARGSGGGRRRCGKVGMVVQRIAHMLSCL